MNTKIVCSYLYTNIFFTDLKFKRNCVIENAKDGVLYHRQLECWFKNFKNCGFPSQRSSNIYHYFDLTISLYRSMSLLFEKIAVWKNRVLQHCHNNDTTWAPFHTKYRQFDCFFHSFFGRIPIKTSKVRITGPLWVESSEWLEGSPYRYYGIRLHINTVPCNFSLGYLSGLQHPSLHGYSQYKTI